MLLRGRNGRIGWGLAGHGRRGRGNLPHWSPPLSPRRLSGCCRDRASLPAASSVRRRNSGPGMRSLVSWPLSSSVNSIAAPPMKISATRTREAFSACVEPSSGHRPTARLRPSDSAEVHGLHRALFSFARCHAASPSVPDGRPGDRDPHAAPGRAARGRAGSQVAAATTVAPPCQECQVRPDRSRRSPGAAAGNPGRAAASRHRQAARPRPRRPTSPRRSALVPRVAVGTRQPLPDRLQRPEGLRPPAALASVRDAGSGSNGQES